jgi:hypothetical protein
MQVHVDPLADAMFGVIERELRHDVEALGSARLAYFEIIAELRRAMPHVWLVDSDIYQDTFALHHPPLVAHFRRVSDDKVRIIDFQRIPKLPWDA